MRTLPLILVAAFVIAAALPATGQGPNQKVPFTVEFDPKTGVEQEVRPDARPDGKKGLHFTVKFSIIRHTNEAPGKDYKVMVEEDDIEVARLPVPEPKVSEELSVVLAIDISGSMARPIGGNLISKRIDEARAAAESFVDRLSPKAECGLILFDHEIRPEEKIPPGPAKNRPLLRQLIQTMQPRGGTAYLDATDAGVAMLGVVSSRSKLRERAVVVMTDGVDLNSNVKLGQVIDNAKAAGVKVYTIGIGEPGLGKPVNSVLVLDRSQSMDQPAEENEARTKIEAMHNAASRFVEIMPASAKTTILPFDSVVGLPDKPSNNKFQHTTIIKSLKPQGETAMLDAAYDAVAALAAANLEGHNAVVVMTDGIDNMSRRRPEEVIKRAKEANIPVYMLAFGRDSEMSQAAPDMEKIAKATGGSFHRARTEKDLIRIFEDMSNALHDDGIDLKSLTRLADETGGKYYPAHEIKNLKLILEQISKELPRKEYTITFASLRGHDGLARKISIKLVKSTGEVVAEQKTDKAVRGVVLAEMNPFVYLGFLALLGFMLALPAAIGRMTRRSAA